MKIVEVPGVLNRNSVTRDEHLRRNYGKYFQYNEKLVPAIGEVYDIDYNRPLYSITDNQSLLEYTHNGNQPYGNLINRKYFNKNREKDIYSVKSLNFDQIQAWGGDYTDYISYLDDVLGEDIYSRHVRYVNDFLSGQYMENAIRQTEVGVIRNINVPIAKQGIITTNPNNLKGLDTPLGTITNYMYSTLLYNGAIFNSDRKSEDKYITRSLINQYGNNLSNVTKLGDMLRVGVGDYELRDDLGADVHIIHSFEDAVGDLNIHWMTKNVENAKKYLAEYNEGFKGYELGKEGYVNYIEGKENILDLTEFSKEVHFKSEYNPSYDKTYDIYNENDNADNGYTDAPTNENDAAWENYKKIDGSDEDSKSILVRTSRLFNEHKINTLVGRFHTSVDGGIPTEQEFIDTAKSKYGNSHGRNLLTRKAQDSEVADADDTNGYDNPYCRTWTYHHQYNQVKKLIRPFITVDENGEEKAVSIESVQMINSKYRSRDKKGKLIGPKYLGDNTVLNKNGFVNICPSGDQNAIAKNDKGENIINENAGTRIEKCMFSIENLAWKDVPKFTKENYISKEQTGPNGGRIMWFPPYDLSFSENVNVAWNESTFIGRGEKVYTYTNTDRTGTLSFTLLIDHPSVVNTFSKMQNGDISSDIDSDILRFFAGCEIPEFKEPEEPEKPTTPPGTGETVTEKEGSFSFYVYFPNNYTGILSKNKRKLNDNDDIIERDKDWWAYILAGNNCSLKEDKNLWVGYETTENNGVSMIFANDHKERSEEEIKEIKESIHNQWIGVSDCWWKHPGQPYCVGKNEEYDQGDYSGVNKENGDWCFKYRVDKDFRQKLGKRVPPFNPQHINFEDGTSSQLNTLLSDYQKGADYTFGEVICALIEAKKIKNEETDIINTDDLLIFLKEHGTNDNSIKELLNIITAEGIKYKDISVQGSADRNDQSNSRLLANRRAMSIKFLLKDCGIDGEKFTFSADGSEKKPENIVSNIKNKLERFSYVTVKYTLPGTKQTFSYSSENATNQEEPAQDVQEQEEDKFNTWFDTLLKNSEILSEYKEIFDNEDYEVKYELFKEDIRKQCLNNKISYNVEDYKTDQDWIKVIDQFVDIYKYMYFIPSCKLYNYNDDFITQLNKHKPINSDVNIDKRISEVNSEVARLYDESDEYAEKASGLTKDVTKLEERRDKKDIQGKTLSDKIEDCKAKISCYTYGNCKISDGEIIDCESGTTQYKSEINKINYELNHWTTEKGDKRQLVNELQRCERENSNLENKIGKEEVKQDRYQQELDEINEEISGLTNEIERYQEIAHNDWVKAGNLGDELDRLIAEKDAGIGVVADRVRSEIYFERFETNITNELEKLKGNGPDGESDKFNYPAYDGSTTNLFEIGIELPIPGEFPYDGYDATHDKGFIKEETLVKMSYNLLLKEFLLIKLLDEKIETGFEFACDYLMQTQEEDATFDKNSDYEQIKDLLLIQYLLSGEKNKDKTPATTGAPSWNVSTEGTSANISYYDAWAYMIEADSKGYLSIVYEPFKNTLKEVSSAIDKYKGIQDPTDNDFKELMKVLTGRTENVSKYCETVIDDIMSYVTAYAETSAYEAAEAAEQDAKDKQSQKLKRRYKSECDTLAKIKESVDKKREQYLYSIFVGSGYTRYENEGEYFNKLDIEHPLIFKSIKEKFKYFNPAFHSMSPEGFNARLNFLHQCTRQGHTYEAKSDNGVKTANNLAFGRMPVCVLRIGDFINTRIIINNININYDNGGMQWDLNPEGIGVQPMYAKVNLGITIIGGQSLAGPISRLQNAVSFDYYANTGVYDDRADRLHRDANGNLVYDYIFNIDPQTESDIEYTLYQTTDSQAELANKSTIDMIKERKEEYDSAQKELDDFNLTEGNNQCKK